MSVLNVRNKDGVFEPVITLKGDKGDRGDRGNGIENAVQNEESVTLTFTDGETFTFSSESQRAEAARLGAMAAASEAEGAKNAARGYAAEAEGHKSAAETAKTAAETAKDNAAASAVAAEAAEVAAQNCANEADASAAQASLAAEEAETQAAASAASARRAEDAAEEAEESAALSRIQYDLAEKPAGENRGKLYQHIGPLGTYTPGRFYVSALQGGEWVWLEVVVDNLSGYLTDTDYATENRGGAVRVSGSGYDGIMIDGVTHRIGILKASDAEIDAKTNTHKPIVPANLDRAVRSVRPATSGSAPATLEVNTIYDLGVQTALSLDFPATGQLGDFVQVDFMSGDTPTTLNVSSSAGLSDFDLAPEAGKIYTIFADWGRLYQAGASHVDGWRLSYAEYTHTA